MDPQMLMETIKSSFLFNFRHKTVVHTVRKSFHPSPAKTLKKSFLAGERWSKMSTSHFKRKKMSCTFPTFSYFSFFFLLFAVSIPNLAFSHFPSTWQLLFRAGKGGQWTGKSVPAGFFRTGNVVMDTLLTGIIIMCSSYLLALAQRLTSLDFVAMVRWIRYRSTASIIITGG